MDRDVIDVKWSEVRPGSPPLTAEEFRSWSWPARAVYVVLASVVVVAGYGLARFLWGLFGH